MIEQKGKGLTHTIVKLSGSGRRRTSLMRRGLVSRRPVRIFVSRQHKASSYGAGDEPLNQAAFWRRKCVGQRSEHIQVPRLIERTADGRTNSAECA
jgi:hypothetical protein